MPYAALLDADVLFRIRLTDFLLSAAEVHLFRPLWSAVILDEASRNIKAKFESVDPQSIDSRFSDMCGAFPAAEVTGFEGLISAMTNDEKDRHVLAAAVVGRADVIVTFNLTDYPDAARKPLHIAAQAPDEFALHLWTLYPPAIIQVLHSLASKRVRGTWTARQVLEELTEALPGFVAAVSSSGLIP